MTKKLQLAGTMALVAAVAISVVTPAQANDLTNALRYFVGNGLPTSSAPNQALIESNFTTRQNQLDAQISSELAAGHLTSSQAAQLRAELANIASLMANARLNGGFTFGETNQINDAFTALTTRVTSSIAYATPVATVATSGSMNLRLNDLNRRIEAAFRSGAITGNQHDNLRNSARFLRREARRMSFDGMTLAEETRLNASIDRVSARLDSVASAYGRGRGNGYGYGHYRNHDDYDDNSTRVSFVDLDSRQAQFLASLNAGVTDGRLTASEAAMLRAEFNDIARAEANMRFRPNPLRLNQLAQQMTSLENRLTQDLSDAEIAGRNRPWWY